MRAIRFTVVTIVVFLLAACQGTSRIQPVVEQPVIRVADPAAARPVQFSRIVIDLKRGTQIGTYREGVSLCTTPGTLVYRGGRMTFDDRDLSETFRHELESANYRVVGDPDALFEDSSAWQAEYLIAGRVTRIDADFCYTYNPWEQVTKISGAAAMDVDWQVYSRLDRTVVYRESTQGRGERAEGSTSGETDVLLDAFAQSTRNLLADQKFHDLLAGDAQSPAASAQSAFRSTGAAVATLTRSKLFSGPIGKNVGSLRQSVVTILVPGGHGSGFFIDETGDVLTNAHVVEGAQQLRIVLAGGMEATGQVVASDRRRDVALVKVVLGHTGGLPLQRALPDVGAEIYAMGTPLDPSLSATLSKGIVSAIREKGGQRYIQSDVNVMQGSSGGPLLDASGNVVGLTVSGLTEGDVSLGVNYFIPIDDALAALGIQVAAAPS